MKTLWLSLLFLLPFQEAFPQNRFITIDSVKVWLNTQGLENRKAGQPVIVFESGKGSSMGNWDRVLEGAVKLAPILTYDRAGVGESEAVEAKPTIKMVSDRLVKILKHLEIEPPYLLVGHSLGGLYVRGFAIHHPELLAGLVIIDPADFTENHINKREYYEVLNWEEERVDSLINSYISKRNNRNPDTPPGILREGVFLEEIREREFQEITESPLPNIPVHIITGGRFDLPEKYRSKVFDEEAVFRAKIQARCTRWISVIQSVDKGMFFYSADSGHSVQWEDPELVISSIKLAIEDYWSMKSKKKD
ncbi:MAG: alpha/beta hydrolase [Bacteroidia bacterium]|nr:alpha/beta hydrolase [Bacteroidia bacterium]